MSVDIEVLKDREIRYVEGIKIGGVRVKGCSIYCEYPGYWEGGRAKVLTKVYGKLGGGYGIVRGRDYYTMRVEGGMSLSLGYIELKEGGIWRNLEYKDLERVTKQGVKLYYTISYEEVGIGVLVGKTDYDGWRLKGVDRVEKLRLRGEHLQLYRGEIEVMTREGFENLLSTEWLQCNYGALIEIDDSVSMKGLTMDCLLAFDGNVRMGKEQFEEMGEGEVLKKVEGDGINAKVSIRGDVAKYHNYR